MKNVMLNQVAEVELIYKTKIKASLRPTVTSAREAYKILLSAWDINKLDLMEQFKVLLLSHGKRVLGLYQLSSGGVAGTVVDPKLIFIAALKANASAILISHNHPSGALKPSPQDIKLTEKIITAGKALDILVLDHLIITSEGYYSFAEEGLI